MKLMWIDEISEKKQNEGRAGIWTRDLLHPKQES